VKKLVAEVRYGSKPQYYFVVERVGGQFGTGAGEEMANTSDSESGSYLPVWVPVSDLPQIVVYPPSIASFITEALKTGWPDEAQRFRETLHK
jgi:8-oxo-dGTP diphosphatase